MKKWFVIVFLLFSFYLQAQVTEEQSVTTRRKPSHKEVKTLAHLADSVLRELKVLYKLEQKENSPQKYQPDRIALVRSYLLIFQHLETSCSVVAYSKGDITQIFGKPDTTFKAITADNIKEEEWLYSGVDKKYIRIQNLRYRFYFKQGTLDRVRRM